MCHDLIEDTDCLYDEIEALVYDIEIDNWDDAENIIDPIRILTKDRGISYENYIISIKESESVVAYIIKLADMKDHLLRKETLTDRLKEKYWNAIPHLL